MMLWQHRKGGVYRIVGWTVIEDGWKPAVIYAPVDSTGTCTRPCAEFFDGRFTPLVDTISVPPAEPERPEADFTLPLPRRAAYQIDDGA